MAEATPKWIDGLSYTGLSLRRGDLLIGMHDGTTLGVRAGVRPGGNGLNVTLAGSTITVATGVAMVQYQSGQGIYRAALAPSTNLTLQAAHATLSRIDLVYLRVWDNNVDASGLNQADAVYLAGTAASSPVAPTPAGTQIYIPLATITVPPSGGGSPTVSTAVMPFTVAPGGILPSSTAPSTPYIGQAYHNGTDLLIWNGSGWDTYFKTPGAWQAYSVAWTASTTNPAIGNGTMTGRYALTGKTCHVSIKIVPGSTTTFGSGTYTFNVPFASSNDTVEYGGFARLSSGGNVYIGQSAIGANVNTFNATFPQSGSPALGANMSPTAPTTFASGNLLRLQLTYQIA
jgi:hypothetical protein